MTELASAQVLDHQGVSRPLLLHTWSEGSGHCWPWISNCSSWACLLHELSTHGAAWMWKLIEQKVGAPVNRVGLLGSDLGCLAVGVCCVEVEEGILGGESGHGG